MSFLNRKVLALVGATAAAVASTAVLATPAQAASAGLAKVTGTSGVQFRALMGKANGLTITIKGRTVTLDDKVAIKAGKGCKAVKGDKTKVKCTTSKKTTKLSIALGDKNDWVVNKTSVYMLADGGTGNDKLTGGSGKDQLQGASGADQLYGRNGVDTLIGGTGNDRIDGGAGNDLIDGNSGNDSIWGGTGNDAIVGQAGNDRVAGGAGDDIVIGEAGNDTIYGDAGNDFLIGENITETAVPYGNTNAVDRINGGANWAAGDICHVFAKGSTAGCENVIPNFAAASAQGAGIDAATLARLAAVVR